MAAMDQAKLDNMCTKINGKADEYVSTMNAEVKNLLKTFNENWVSNESRKLATEIKDCLDSISDSLVNTFSAKNSDIKSAVSVFNSEESENITYSGFEFTKPSIDLTLNETLPNEKVGVADNADLNTIQTPVKTLITNINDILDGISSTVASIDAFSINEQNALTTAISDIKTTFAENMETNVTTPLSSRMSEEISKRETSDKIIIDRLS